MNIYMIAEIITKDNKKYKVNNRRITSIKWSNKHDCFLVNNKIHVDINNIKSITCSETI